MGAIDGLSPRAGPGLDPVGDRLFERVAALSSDLIYIYDAVEQRTVYRSRPGLPVVWVGFDRPGGASDRAPVHPDDLPALRLHRARLECLLDGDAAEIRFRVGRDEGGYRWLSSRETVLTRRPDGGLRRLLGSACDLGPAAPDGEEALRDREERLRLATSLAGIGTWDWDLRTDSAVNSESFFRLYGLAPSERPPTMDEWLERVHPDDRARMRTLTERGLSDGILPETEFRVVWPDGSVHWLLGKGQVFRDDAGRRVRMVGISLDITERKQAELALRESESRFRQLADSMPQIVWTAGPDGQLDYLNRRGCALTGLASCDDAVDQAWLGVLHPDDVMAWRERWYGAVATGDSYEAEYRVKDGATGDYRWHLGRALAVRDVSGAIVRWYGSSTDIDDQQRFARTLEESRERLRVALSASGTGTFRWYVREDRVEWDEALDRLLGLRREQSPTRHDQVIALVHPSDRDWVAAEIAHCVESGADFDMEFRVVWPDGRIRWLANRGITIRDADGRTLCMTGACVDITERRRADRELRISEARYRSLVAATSAIVWTTDARGQFVEPQPSWEAFTGQTWREYARTGRVRAVHPDDRRAVAKAWLAAVRERRVYETEGRIWHAPSGEYRHCWTRAVPMIDPGSTLREWIGCVLDVTDRWRAQAEITRLNETLEQRVAERTAQLAEANRKLQEHVAERRQAEEALRQSQKIEAVGRLTGGVAHDFNNLLTIILGNLEMLERLIPDSIAQRHVRSAAHAAERGAKLAEQLLAFSRKQRLSPKPIDLNRLVAGMQDLLQRTLGSAIVIETRLEAAPWPAMADVNQLELVILNLAINARDAMSGAGEGGGTLTITTANAVVAADEPELSAGDYVMVAVTDTGSGMSEEVRARAFEPFFTTKEVGKGSGLGLSMVYGVAAQLGGTVRLDSQLGEGTTVRIYLPRAAAAPVRAPMAAPAVSPSAVPDTTILLIDDDHDVRGVTAVTLRNLGYTVVEGADGRTALERLAQPNDIALLLVDFGMPGMDGVEVARRARALRPDLAVLVSTGYAEDGPFAGPLEGELVLKKPYRAQDLAAHIQQALESARARPAETAAAPLPG